MSVSAIISLYVFRILSPALSNWIIQSNRRIGFSGDTAIRLGEQQAVEIRNIALRGMFSGWGNASLWARMRALPGTEDAVSLEVKDPGIMQSTEFATLHICQATLLKMLAFWKRRSGEFEYAMLSYGIWRTAKHVYYVDRTIFTTFISFFYWNSSVYFIVWQTSTRGNGAEDSRQFFFD